MGNDGSQLEALVAFVERTLVPQGFDVKTQQRVYNDEGVQIAEFDVEVRGKVGTTSIAWLIECRDRPGSGPASGSWIEQLIGRRERFRFNKVTAVSTTGFATGAVQFARTQGIELREVASLTPDAFSSWLELRAISQVTRRATLESARVLLPTDTTAAEKAAVSEALKVSNGATKLLRLTSTGQVTSLSNAFLYNVQTQNLFDGIKADSESRTVRLHVRYESEDDHFVIGTPVGPVRVEAIRYVGTLEVLETLVPIAVTSEYRSLETGEVISQVAGFAPHEVQGMHLSLELHRLGETGETHVLLRRVDRDA